MDESSRPLAITIVCPGILKAGVILLVLYFFLSLLLAAALR